MQRAHSIWGRDLENIHFVPASNELSEMVQRLMGPLPFLPKRKKNRIMQHTVSASAMIVIIN